MMSKMKMQFAGLLAASALALSAGQASAVPYTSVHVAAVSPAFASYDGAKVENVQGRRGGWRGGGGSRGGRGIGLGLGAGILGGALLGNALSAPNYHDRSYSYYPTTRYYAGPGYPAYSNSAAYCAQRFRSYDRASGTYLGYDGNRHACP